MLYVQASHQADPLPKGTMSAGKTSSWEKVSVGSSYCFRSWLSRILPARRAHHSRSQPTRHSFSMDILAATRSSATSKWPFATAANKDVKPNQSLMFGLILAVERRTCTARYCPYLEAKKRAVRPRWSVLLASTLETPRSSLSQVCI